MVLYILSHFFISTRFDLQSLAIATFKNRKAVEMEKGLKLSTVIYELMHYECQILVSILSIVFLQFSIS